MGRGFWNSAGGSVKCRDGARGVKLEAVDEVVKLFDTSQRSNYVQKDHYIPISSNRAQLKSPHVQLT